jgi:hypothetical protein
MEDNGARVKLKSALVPEEVYRRALKAWCMLDSRR